MSEMTTTELSVGGSYQKIVDTAVSAFVAQVTGVSPVQIVFTAGSAPADTVRGFVLNQNEAVSREHGDGHVYAKAANKKTSITVAA